MESRQRITVDLSDLTGKVFIGRPRGKMARQHFNLERYSPDNHVLEFVVPKNTISINSSFFLGLFGRDINALKTVDDVFSYIDISKIDRRLQVQLIKAVERTLSKSDFGL